MMTKIHVNCDMGESYGRYQLVDDRLLMPFISACNIACGFHAGDPLGIDKTIKEALIYDIEIGAHPSYPDRQGFGRRFMGIKSEELEALVRYQISALKGMVEAHGGKLNHVKAHGALYNRAAYDEATALAIIRAVKSVDHDLILYVPSISTFEKVALGEGLSIAREVFIDRQYNKDLSLVSRRENHAVIKEPEEAFSHVKRIVDEGFVRTHDGHEVRIEAETFCIHGDNPNSVSILEYLESNFER